MTALGVALVLIGVAATWWGWHTAITDGYEHTSPAGTFVLAVVCIYAGTTVIFGGNQ